MDCATFENNSRRISVCLSVSTVAHYFQCCCFLLLLLLPFIMVNYVELYGKRAGNVFGFGVGFGFGFSSAHRKLHTA